MFVRNGQKLGSILHDRTPAVRSVEDGPGMAAEAEPKPGSKAALQAEAEALGISTDGTKAELQARLDEHSANDGTKEESSGDDDLHG